MSEEVQKAKGDEAAAMFLLGQMAHPQSDEELRRENDRLKREKAQLEGELDDAKEEVAQERDRAEAANLRVQLQQESSDEQLAEAQKKVDALRREKENLEAKKADLEEIIDSGSTGLDAQELKAKQEALDQAVALANAQEKLLKLEKEAAQKECEAEKAQLKLELETEKSASKAAQKECEEEKAQLETEKAALEAAKKKCEEEKTELKAKEAALEDAQQNCEKEKTELKTELKAKEAALKAAEKKCKDEKAGLEAKFTQEEKEWEAEKTQLQSEIRSRDEQDESKTSDLQAEIEQLKKIAEEKEAEKTASEEKIAELEREAEETKTASEKKIAENEKVINSLREELKTFEEIVISEGESKGEGESKTNAATITEFLKKREKELENTRAELKTMQDDFTRVTNEIFGESKNSETKMDPRLALKELRQNKKEEDSIKASLEETLLELERLGMAAAESDTVKKNLSEEIASLNNRLGMAIADCDTKKKDLREKIKDLKNKNKGTLIENANLENKILEIQENFKQKEINLEEKTAEAAKLTETLEGKEKSIADLTKKNTEAANEMATLKARLKNLEEKSKLQNKSPSEETNNEIDHKKKYEELKKFYRSQISDWKSKNDNLKRQFENLQQSKASYPAYYKMLEERVKKIDTIELENFQLRIDTKRKVEEVTRSYETKIALAISRMDEELKKSGQPLKFRNKMLRQNNDELRRTIDNMETERNKERNMLFASLQKKIGEMKALRENELKHLSQLDILQKKLQSCLNTSKSETTGESKENYEKFRKKVSDLEATIQNLETEKSQTQEKFAAALLKKDKELKNAENEIIDLKNQLSRQQVPSDGRSNLKQNREHDVKKGIAAVEFLIDTEFWNEINFSPSVEDNLAQQIFQFLSSQDASVQDELQLLVLDENKKPILLNNTTKEKFFQQLLLGVRNSLLLSESFNEDNWKLSLLIVSVVLKLKEIVIDNFEIEYEESTDEIEKSRELYLSRLRKIRRYLRVGKRRDTVKQLSQSVVFQKLFQINGKTVSVKVFLTQLRDAIKKENQTSLSTYNGILEQLEDFQSEVRNTMRGNISTDAGKTRSGVSYTDDMELDSEEYLLFPKLKF
jgi:hypothetical protein